MPAKKKEMKQMEISIGAFVFVVLGSASFGAFVGAFVIGLFAAAQVDSLERQLDAERRVSGFFSKQ